VQRHDWVLFPTKPISCWLIGTTTLVLALETVLINCYNMLLTHGQFKEKNEIPGCEKLLNYRAIVSVLIERFSQNIGGMIHAVPHLHKQFLPTHLPPQMFCPQQPHCWTSASSAGYAKIGINRPKSVSLGGKSTTSSSFTRRKIVP